MKTLTDLAADIATSQETPRAGFREWWRASRWPAAAVAVLMALTGVSSTGQVASAATADTNWTIRASFYSPSTGDDVPLRYGRIDTSTQTGFGWRHMVARYHATETSYTGWVSKIDYTLDHCKAVSIGSGKYNCTYYLQYNQDWRVTVIYTDRIDAASRDSRPVGVITAYMWQANCGC